MEVYQGTRQPVEPYYVIMKDPGAEGGGVHADFALHPSLQEQHDLLDVREVRRAELREDSRLQVPPKTS